jgi:hypothetical protein
MTVIHYIGLDVHKKTISYCIKTAAGQIVRQGKLEATRSEAGPKACRCHGTEPWKRLFSVPGSTTH